MDKDPWDVIDGSLNRRIKEIEKRISELESALDIVINSGPMKSNDSAIEQTEGPTTCFERAVNSPKSNTNLTTRRPLFFGDQRIESS